MGYPQQSQFSPQNPYGQQQQGAHVQDPWANGNLPTGSYDGADPFDNAIPDQRGQRAQLAGPDGQPYLHHGEPVMVSPPSLRTLGPGRLIFIVPKKIERNMKNPFEGGWKDFIDRLTADVIVCDGAGERFGGDPTKGIPDLLGPFPVPCVIEDMWIQNDGIIERVPEGLIGKGFKIGRLAKVKTKSNRPAWNFNSPDEDPAKAAAIVQSLRPLWAAYLAQQLPILSLKTLAERYGVKPGATGAAPQATASPYVQQQMPYGGMAQPIQQPQMVPTPYGQVPIGSVHPEYAAAVTAPGAQVPPEWPTMQPGQNMAPFQQGGPTQPVSAPVAPAADWTLSVALPAALEPFRGMWAGLDAGQREKLLSQAGVVNPNAQQPAGPAPYVRPGAGAYEQGPGY